MPPKGITLPGGVPIPKEDWRQLSARPGALQTAFLHRKVTALEVDRKRGSTERRGPLPRPLVQL